MIKLKHSQEALTILNAELSRVTKQIIEQYDNTLELILKTCRDGQEINKAFAPNSYLSCSNLHSATLVHMGSDNRLQVDSNVVLATVTINHFPMLSTVQNDNDIYQYKTTITIQWNQEIKANWLKLLEEELEQMEIN